MPDDRRAGKGRSLKATRAAVLVPSARRKAETTLVEPTPADLSGLTLVETVKRFVLEDPKLRQLQTRMHRDCPGWSKSVSSSWWNPAHAPWRVKFENWDTPEERALSWKYCYRTLDQPSYVPEQVTAVCRRFLGRLASLLRWLQDGSLVAEGTKEPPTDELACKPINAGWWSRDDVEVNFEKGNLLRIVDHKPVLVFSDIRVWRPEDVAFDTGRGVESAGTNYKDLLQNCTVKEVVVRAGKELINEGDEGGPGFPRRVYKRMGSPKKPPFETVRKYVPELFPDQKKSCPKK